MMTEVVWYASGSERRVARSVESGEGDVVIVGGKLERFGELEWVKE
jgi:hypothetical protein